MDKNNNEVVFVIPLYNEAEVVRGVLESVLDKYSRVVCINDGSRDNSREEALKTTAMLIDHPINMGQGAALQTGIEFARTLPGAKYFVTFDADGQHRLADVERMLDTIRKEKCDIVLGSRFLGNVVGITRSKLIILKIAVAFSNATSGLKLTDTHNGLRVFNKKFADDLQLNVSDMAHASEFLEIIVRGGYTYREVPVTIEYTNYSRSKGQSIINAINIGFDTILRRLSR